MKPRRRWQTGRLLTDNKGKQFKPSKDLRRREKCLRGKRICGGRGFWIFTGDCCSSMKDAILRREGFAPAPPDFSIKPCSPENLFSHTFYWRASHCMSESPPLRNWKRRLPPPGLSACRRRCSPTRRTFCPGSLLRIVAIAQRLLLPLARRATRSQLCAAGCIPKS